MPNYALSTGLDRGAKGCLPEKKKIWFSLYWRDQWVQEGTAGGVLWKQRCRGQWRRQDRPGDGERKERKNPSFPKVSGQRRVADAQCAGEKLQSMVAPEDSKNGFLELNQKGLGGFSQAVGQSRLEEMS